VTRRAAVLLGSLLAVLVATATLLALPEWIRPAAAEGVGEATWTPSESATTARTSRFLVPQDAIAYRTDAVWDADQSQGLAAYLEGGLRYTHEVNDRSGRLSATGFWATNHPDPSYDRDDDDGDRRWEEAEIIAGPVAPEPGLEYTSVIQFSRWHGKRVKGTCEWAWDRRKGETVVLSQLSRDILGEWQAERYTFAYEALPYARAGLGPELPEATARARCRDADPRAGQQGYVITFARPLSWTEMSGLVPAGSARWTAFEAVGSSTGDDRIWTCGGPFDRELRMGPCQRLGVEVEGLTAMAGFLDDEALEQLRESPDVVAIDRLRDSLTGLLFDVGGFGVERPGLTVNDRYWELVLND
jgi:hypothetical protein